MGEIDTPKVVAVPDEFVAHILADTTRMLHERCVRVSTLSPAAFAAGGAPVHDTAEVALVGVAFRFTRELMEKMPRLRAVVSAVIGIDTIDVRAASDLGIYVGYSRNDATAQSAAEATILLMLALLYDLKGNERRLRENLPRPVHPPSRMLRGRIVGLVGFGAAARAVAERLRAWGVEILACRRRAHPEDSNFPYVRFVSLEELLARSDLVSVHASLNSETRNLLDAAKLKLMKRGSYLINTARGGIVDEEAAHELAATGHLRGIALDAFQVEPLPSGNPLRTLDNAILTPHVLGHTSESYAALSEATMHNALDVLAGKPPRYCANAEPPGTASRRSG